jgi:hypothetical protein
LTDSSGLYQLGYLATAGIFVLYAVLLIGRRTRARREESTE